MNEIEICRCGISPYSTLCYIGVNNQSTKDCRLTQHMTFC